MIGLKEDRLRNYRSAGPKEDRKYSYNSIKYCREVMGFDVNYGGDKWYDKNYISLFSKLCSIVIDADIPSEDGHYVIIKSDRGFEPDEAVYYQVFDGKPVDYHVLTFEEIEKIIFLELKFLVNKIKKLSNEIKNKLDWTKIPTIIG